MYKPIKVLKWEYKTNHSPLLVDNIMATNEKFLKNWEKPFIPEVKLSNN